jgi:hypothetical protein
MPDRPKKLISKRTGDILRYACAVASALAAFVFALFSVLLCIAGIEERNVVAFLIGLPLFGLLSGFAAYISWGCWRGDSAKTNQKIIAELQSYKFQSLEYYDIASRHFCRRLRVIRNCGLFVICLGTVFGAGAWTAWNRKEYWHIIGFLAGFFFCARIGWTPYQMGKWGIRSLKTSRKAGLKHRLNALRFAAAKSKPFRGDPIGIYVSQRFDEDQVA